jgi:predicted ABC-type ATPase
MKSLTELINDLLKQSPVQLVLTGSNGAGKSTFYESYLKASGLPFVNADAIAKQMGLVAPEGAYQAAQFATQKRIELTNSGLSFIFETVFSDTGGHKLAEFAQARVDGYTVAMIFIGIDSTQLSRARVVNRVARGGHDVPDDKLDERFPRTLANLATALTQLDWVLLLDNSSASQPYRPIALVVSGEPRWLSSDHLPMWAASLQLGGLKK